MKGLVKWFSTEKGYGFITDKSDTDYFFHVSKVVGTELPQPGDAVKFNFRERKKGKVATDIEIIRRKTVQNHTPYFGRRIQRDEVVDGGSSKVGSTALSSCVGLALGGPVGAVVGAALGYTFGEEREPTFKKVFVTSKCIRCGGTGYVTARVNERTGFQCLNCHHFWKVSDAYMSPEDIEALESQESKAPLSHHSAKEIEGARGKSAEEQKERLKKYLDGLNERDFGPDFKIE